VSAALFPCRPVTEIPGRSQFWDLPQIGGMIKVSRAAETSDTALKPLTDSVCKDSSAPQ